MTIIPIFRWGLVAAAREGRLQGERSTFAGGLAIIVVGTFGAWYYWSDGQITSRTLGRVTDQALGWTSLFHFAICASFALRGAAAIAKERDRRTLDFLLATRLNNAEIVLGKLAACLLVGFGTLAAGLPVLLLLHVLGGVDLRLILLGLAGFASSVLFISSWAIWFSAEARSFRMAAAPFMLLVPLWMIGPFFVSMILPRLGYHLPEWAAAVNWWLLASSPVAVAFRMVLGLDSWTQLVFIVGRMIGIQLLGALLVTIVAIARLRAADRALASGDRSLLRRERRRPVWRLWSRPPVGDDPILWREMYTARGNGLMKAIGWLLNAGCLAVLAYATSCFAAPAVREAWEHGYPLAVSDVNRPEFNLFLRIFLPGAGPNQPIDLARIDFNLFLRYATTAMAVVLAVGGAATPGEVLDRERA
ncbi:MAG TPA: ABC transporter permease subunit, partial [Isosphaeraceae bacterium]|nr:ABC transporter permease subunit [Isosphaeraceae bacterium]